MRTVHKSSWSRIVLLVLAVLFVHTDRIANHLLPSASHCTVKVATARPEAEKKFLSTIRKALRPRSPSPSRGPHFGDSLALLLAHGPTVASVQPSLPAVSAPDAPSIAPQYRRFALRV